MVALEVMYTQKDNTVHMASYDGKTWSDAGQACVKNGSTSTPLSANSNVSSVVYNDTSYILYTDKEQRLCYAQDYGKIFIDPQYLSDSKTAAHTPYATNIVVFNNSLVTFYIKEKFGNIYYMTFNGCLWSEEACLKSSTGQNIKADLNPCTTVFQDKIYIYYKNSSKYYLSILEAADINTEIISKEDKEIKLADTPDIAKSNLFAYESKINIIYTGGDFKLRRVVIDPETLSQTTSIIMQGNGTAPLTAVRPVVAAINGTLLIFYIDKALQALFVISLVCGAWTIAIKIGVALIVLDVLLRLATQVPNAPDWMANIPGTTSIFEINIPGSHDAAAITGTGYKTPYACHNRSITNQLMAGIRLLDVRLQIKKVGASYTFTTCHGAIGSMLSLNLYQSFNSLMVECVDFLDAHPDEVILMSLKVDDWSKVDDDAADRAAALAALLAMLNGYVNTAGAAVVNTALTVATSNIGALRGKIQLFNRIDTSGMFGPTLDIPDNTPGAMTGPTAIPATPNLPFPIYVQDQYKGLPFSGSGAAKTARVTAAFGQKAAGNVVWNFASATWYGLWGVRIMSNLLAYFGVLANRVPNPYGWILFDYPCNMYLTNPYGYMNIVQLMIASNAGYAAYPQAFTVTDEWHLLYDA